MSRKKIPEDNIMNDFNFSAEKFSNPDNNFYPVYSWMWNDILSKDEIKIQLDEMYERNIRGVYVIPLPSQFRPDSMVTALEPEYLSDGYFEMLSFAADYARSKNMCFWLYDEGGWPSGNGNFLVTCDDKSLRLRRIRKGRIKAENKSDLTNPEATKKFISVTHEKHKEKMGKSFYSFAPFVFTDEPGIGELPFTKSIKAEYKKRTGRRLSKRKLIKNKDPELNITYHDICSSLFAENYFKPIKKWCNSNGMMSAGHLDKDHDILGYRQSYHHPLRQLRLLDVPGVDVIWGQIVPDRYCGFFPRLASSAAEQSGSGLSLSESFSVYGTMTYEQMRYIIGYQLVRGISIFNFMLLMYNNTGYYSIRQRPDFSKELPGAEYLKAFNSYTASLQYIMQKGKPATDCALYLPMRSLWADDEDSCSALKNYETAGEEIEKHHSQFDIIDDDLILGCCSEKLKDGIITMGRAEYKFVYIPADKYMPEEVKERLDAFVKGGGKVFCTSDAEYFPALDISGDNGQLRVHKRVYDNCEIYLVFNEGAHKVSADINLPSDMKELDPLLKKICTAKKHYSLESGEIKIFISGNFDLHTEAPYCKGQKICTISDFRIRPVKKFTLSKAGMSYRDTEGRESAIKAEGWSALYGEDFSGKCQYRAEFSYEGQAKDLIISLGRVCYSCEIFFNGVKLSDIFMPPYETVIKKELIKKENELVILVSNTASNAFVHFRLHDEWEEKHIGPYHKRALEFEKKLLSGGLLSDIEIYEKATEPSPL